MEEEQKLMPKGSPGWLRPSTPEVEEKVQVLIKKLKVQKKEKR
jgi:hypothetical protein